MIFYRPIFEYFGKYGVQLLAAIISTLCMVVDGIQFAWISPAIQKLQAPDSIMPLTKHEIEWVAQSYLLGGVIGVIFPLLIFKRISRRLSIFITTMTMALAWIGILLAQRVEMFYVARFVGGIGRNMMFISVPMYLGEIADPEIRGILGTFSTIMFNLGVVGANCITPFFHLYVPCCVGLAFTLIQIASLKFIPESPYYLLGKGHEDSCKRSLRILRQKDDIDEEFKELKIAVERQMQDKGGFAKLFSEWINLKALGILCFIRVGQMMTGISVMTMNIHSILNEIGGNISANTSAIVYSLMMLTSSVCSIGTIDRFGRKTLMIFSCIISSITLFIEGGFFYFKLKTDFNTDEIAWLPILSTFIYIYCYRIGLGTVPIVMISELLSVNVKVAGVVVTDVVCNAASFVANAIFYFTERNVGMFLPFWIFAGICVITAVFSSFLPETRGKSLEEIQTILRNDKKKAALGSG